MGLTSATISATLVYMKIRNGAIYHSKSNNKAARIVRANQDEQIALIVFQNSEQEEVFFSDLLPATSEQVKNYLGK
jgi:hypothetical protein